MQYQLFNIQTSVVVAFYMLTPRKDVTVLEVVFLTAALVVNWVVSIVQPPWHAHGEIHSDAWGAAWLGGGALVVAPAYLLLFA